jgi:fused signal recognition particle receptor
MFDKLKRAFTNAAKSISQKQLSEKDLDNSLFDLQIALLESDVSQEVIDDLSSQIKKNLLGIKIQRNETSDQIILSTLKNNFMEILSKAGSIDLLKLIQEKKQRKPGPFVIVFLGINGTGKTTTVAKVANLLKKSGYSVVIAAADTHRAGAIEQITEHAERLSIKVISQRYGADPSSVSRDALEYAKKHYVDVVLIDTAGRMQTAKNLMYEIGKIVKVIKPDIKLFVGDSLSGNDTINQSREFFSFTEFDGAILTKVDADAKGGAAISISYITSKPILYLGMGQGYDDLVPFDKEKFVNTIFNDESLSISSTISSNNIPKNERNNESYISVEQKSIPTSSAENDFKGIDNNIDLIVNSDIVKDKQNSDNIEKLTTNNLTSELESQKEYNSFKPKDDFIDTTIKSNTYIEDNNPKMDEKIQGNDEQDIANMENKIESGEKKGLFGWFKKKK